MQKCPCDARFPWRHLPCCMEKSRFCLWTCSSVSSFSGNFFRISCLSGEEFWSEFPSRAKENGRWIHFFRLPAGAELAVFGKFLSSGWQKKWSFSGNFCPSSVIKLAVSGKFLSSCWQKTAIPGKFLFFGWHKTDRSRGTDPENPGFFGSQERIFSGFFFRSLKKMSLIADKLYRVSVVFSRRERFFRRFFSVRSRTSLMFS